LLSQQKKMENVNLDMKKQLNKQWHESRGICAFYSGILSIGAICTLLDFIFFCNILVISVMLLHIHFKFSLKRAKFFALRIIYFPFSQFFSNFCFYQTILFFQSCLNAYLMSGVSQLFLAQGPQKAGVVSA